MVSRNTILLIWFVCFILPIQGFTKNFDIVKTSQSFGHSYDYWSITHYDGEAFSKNGRLTIRTLNAKYQDVIGKAKKLSNLVIYLYNVQQLLYLIGW